VVYQRPAKIREWNENEITEWWQASAYQASVSDALRMLDTTLAQATERDLSGLSGDRRGLNR
jgi:hypothetical protein